MTISIHNEAIRLCKIYGNSDNIKIAVKRCLRNKKKMQYIIREAVSRKQSELDFRRNTFCSSGRSLTWFTPRFITAAAMIAELVKEGYTVERARVIALSAVQSESAFWAVKDHPPKVSQKEIARVKKNSCGWDVNAANNLGVPVKHVWQWTAWRNRKRQKPKFGKRTERWFALVEQDRIKARKLNQAKLEEWEKKHLDSLPPELKKLQLTAKCSCIAVSPDGKTVTEFLHDVGGRIVYYVGENNYQLPDSFEQWQAKHDKVYHASS